MRRWPNVGYCWANVVDSGPTLKLRRLMFAGMCSLTCTMCDKYSMPEINTLNLHILLSCLILKNPDIFGMFRMTCKLRYYFK